MGIDIKQDWRQTKRHSMLTVCGCKTKSNCFDSIEVIDLWIKEFDQVCNWYHGLNFDEICD